MTSLIVSPVALMTKHLVLRLHLLGTSNCFKQCTYYYCDCNIPTRSGVNFHVKDEHGITRKESHLL